MTHVPAPDGDSSEEASPDSGNLRVSSKTAHESGIPPARERLARAPETARAIDQLESVLVESTRAEANLGLLLRGLGHLASGAAKAREANAVLLRELETLRERVGRVYENEAVLEQKVRTLQNAVDAAARERDSWLRQEDAFLVELLDDHEQSLLALKQEHDGRLAELDRAFDELRQQRDLARTEATRLSYERDTALALLNEPVAVTERTPAPAPSVLKPKPDVISTPLGAYSLVSDEAGDPAPEDAERRAGFRRGYLTK